MRSIVEALSKSRQVKFEALHQCFMIFAFSSLPIELKKLDNVK